MMPIVALFLDLITQNPVYYFSVVIAVIVSVVLHELGHGVAALSQGDDTPRVLGHMTWNPLVHMGTFSLLLLFAAGIAFGRMPVNPRSFRSRYGNALVAAAGPTTNLILAFLGLTVFALWMKIAGVPPGGAGTLQSFFFIFGMINLILCVFNLLPIPPLDGATVLADFSPPFARLVRNPDNQPFFLGAFLVVFFFADAIFATARDIAKAYLRLYLGS
jgi:Zn-dependent protease